MATITDFNVSPYYDDFADSNNYHRVLFRPSFSIQARELTQAQTILQNQVERFGNNIFKEGDIVVPGGVKTTVRDSIKLTSFTGTSTLSDLKGATLTGGTSGVVAKVLETSAADGTDPNTLFVEYQNSGSNNTSTTFTGSETISGTVVISGVSTSVSAVVNTFHQGVIANISQGIFFVRGFFVQTSEQSLILEKYDFNATYRVGLTIEEKIDTPTENTSLNDNAAGSSNENAPGAHRLKFELTLAKKAIDATDDINFIELTRVINGVTIFQKDQTDYNILSDTLARRTFDESGDYTIRDFDLDIRESVLSGNNRGIYSDGGTTNQGGTASTTKLAALLTPGKAYVKGYEIEKTSQNIVDVEKAREFKDVNANVTQFTLGNFVHVTNMFNIPDLGKGNGSGAGDIKPYANIKLFDTATSSRGTSIANTNADIKEIGRAKCRGIENVEGTASAGIYPTSSVHKAFLFDIEMFTHIEVDGTISNASGFTTGEFVTGGTTGASGVVESISSENSATITGASTATPVVVTCSGGHNFKEGQVVTIAGVSGMTDINGNFTVKNPTATTFEVFSDASSGGTPTAVGSSQTYSGSGATVKHDVVVLSNTQGEFSENEVITGATSGFTARIQFSAFGRKGINIRKFFETRQLFSDVTDIDFTADTTIDSTYGEVTTLTGSISVANSGTAVSGFGTSFTTELVIGDTIEFIDDAGSTTTKIVESIESNTKLEITTAVGGSGVATKTVANRKRAKRQEANLNSAIFKLPYTPVKTLKTTNNSNVTDTSFTVRRTFVETLSSTGGATLNAASGETFLANSNTDYIMTIMSTGSGGSGAVGDVITPTISGTGTQSLTINQGSGYNGHKVKIVATITRTTAGSKSKTKNTGQTVQISTQAEAQADTINLGKADVYELTSVHMAADFSTNATTGDTDVTDRFTLDTGQRDNFYDVGRLVKKVNSIAVTGRLLVTFAFYSHGAGDYFDVDSYPTDQYETIPEYTSDTTGEEFQLRDCLDFRPRVDDASTIESGGPDREFDGTGASTTDTPKFNSLIFTDLEYYLPRIDKLFLSKTGEFVVKKGAAALNPVAPEDLEDAMHIFTLGIAPYTFNPEDVQIIPQDNRRYTMRDIGRLERRIQNVEYYTQLSLLEAAAENLQIQDADGFDRFKNGFIVDNFTGHNIGDVNNSGYNIAMDMARGEARSPHFTDAVTLVESTDTGSTSATDLTDTFRTNQHYKKNGDFLTLPFTETSVISQPFATGVENINPFDVVIWSGQIALDPPSDEWREVRRQPDLQVVTEGAFDTFVAGRTTNRDGSFTTGTVWNEWEDFWTGATTSTVVGSEAATRQRDRVDIIRRDTRVRQRRTGVRTDIVPRIVQRARGDRLVNLAFIPFIRSRTITFTATGLKPSTRVYPFFDNVAVTAYVTPDGGSLGGSLITNANGAVSGTFAIPDSTNDSNPRWRTGTRIFRLTDSSTNSQIENDVNTSAEARYTAEGRLETRQATVHSTREIEFRRTTLTGTQEITRSQTARESVAGTQLPPAPVLQFPIRFDFLFPAGFNFNWFDPLAQSFNIPTEGGAFITSVDVYFRTKDSGVPVTLQLRTMSNGYPTNQIVPLATKTLNPGSVNTSTDGSTATRFTFDAPIYLPDTDEFAIVLLANSTNYNVYVGETGQKTIDSNRLVSKQPSMGILFKSQNGSTWSEDQTKDLKFQLNRALFDVTKTGNVTLVNDSVPTRSLETNALQTTSGSAVIRVRQPNHGMHGTSNNVTISGATATNNIPASEINTTHTSISNITMDSYDITVSTNANATSTGGGSNIVATQNMIVDQAMLNVQTMTLPNCTTNVFLRTTSAKSVNGSQTEFSLLAATAKEQVDLFQNILFTTPQMVASDINQTNEMSGSKSLFNTYEISSAVDNVSPVIDLARKSIFCTQNRLDSPTSGNHPEFVAETKSVGGSSSSAYITRPIELDNESTALDIRISANIRSSSSVELYYRVSGGSETRRIEDIDFRPFNSTGASDSVVPPAEDYETFSEYKYSVDGLEGFTSFQLKAVLKGTNSVYPPRLKDLRGIALAV